MDALDDEIASVVITAKDHAKNYDAYLARTGGRLQEAGDGTDAPGLE